MHTLTRRVSTNFADSAFPQSIFTATAYTSLNLLRRSPVRPIFRGTLKEMRGPPICLLAPLASGEEWRWWGASSFVVRRDVVAAVGGFTDAQVNAEDADLALRLGTAPGFVQITAPVTFAYREHAASAVWDLKRTYAGACSMIGAEQADRYPGGRARAFERRRILTRHTRPVVFGCLQEGLRREAWMLYRATFAWNAALGRGRYLAAFPVLAALSHIRAA
jgi:hypothetical protein